MALSAKCSLMLTGPSRLPLVTRCRKALFAAYERMGLTQDDTDRFASDRESAA